MLLQGEGVVIRGQSVHNLKVRRNHEKSYMIRCKHEYIIYIPFFQLVPTCLLCCCRHLSFKTDVDVLCHNPGVQ